MCIKGFKYLLFQHFFINPQKHIVGIFLQIHRPTLLHMSRLDRKCIETYRNFYFDTYSQNHEENIPRIFFHHSGKTLIHGTFILTIDLTLNMIYIETRHEDCVFKRILGFNKKLYLQNHVTSRQKMGNF